MAKNEAWSFLGLQDEKDTQFVLEQLVQIGLEIVGASQGSLLVVEPDRKNLRFAMVASRSALANFRRLFAPLVGKTVPIGEGITGMAALTHDIQTSTRASGGEKFFHVRGDGSPNAVLAAPMLIGENLVGVITAVRFEKGKAFTSRECKTYGMFANVAAVVVDQQQRLAAMSNASMALTAGSRERKECDLVRDVLALARARPDKVDALQAIVKLLAGF